MSLAVDHPSPRPTSAGGPAHAGVHFPPPLIYAAGLLGGWLLNRWWPLPLAFAPPLTLELIALGFAVTWLVLMASAFATFARARTTLIPNRPATTLATNGPYRITRNPMYLSLAALYLALAIALNSWWPLILLPAVILSVDRFVIAREERYLAAAFPDAYTDYCRRVRRWL